jgi:hypothetical protein
MWLEELFLQYGYKVCLSLPTPVDPVDFEAKQSSHPLWKMQPSATSNPSLSSIARARLLDLIVPLSPLFRREKTSLTTPTPPLTGRNTFLINRIGLRTLGTEINEREVAKVPLAVHLLVTAAQLQQTEVCVCLLSLSLSLSAPAKSLT